MSNPALIAVVLLALAVLVLGAGLAFQWRRRNGLSPSQPARAGSTGEGWVRVEEEKADAAPAKAGPEQLQLQPEKKPPVEAARPNAGDEGQAREGFARMLSEVERALKRSVDGELESALGRIRSVGNEVTEAGNETLRTAAQGLADLDRDFEALRARLAKTGELAATQVQKEAERAAASLRGQEQRASEKLSRKAIRRERRARREGSESEAWPPQAVPETPQAVPEEIGTAEDALAAVQIGEALATICDEAERQRVALAKQTADTEGRLNKSMEELVRAAIGKVRDEVDKAVATAEQKAKAHFANELARNEAEEKSLSLNAELEQARESRDKTVKELEQRVKEAQARAEETMMHAAVIERIAEMSPEQAEQGPGRRNGAADNRVASKNGQGSAPVKPPARSRD